MESTKETSSSRHLALQSIMKPGVETTRNKWEWGRRRVRQGMNETASSDNRWRPGRDGSDEVVCLREREREEEEVYRQSCLLTELAASQTLYEGIWATAEFITVTVGLVTDEDMNLDTERESGWRVEQLYQLKKPQAWHPVIIYWVWLYSVCFIHLCAHICSLYSVIQLWHS